MKKFKLIKEYPHSPKIGTVIEIMDTYWGYREDDCCNNVIFTINQNPGDYPEFWEEVPEDQYKILSLLLANSTNHKISNVSTDSERYIKGLLNCKGNFIHSVKRLCDGEIFTVGDLTNIGKIGSFDKPSGGNIFVRSANRNNPGTLLASPYKQIEKIKESFFTTEDGVEKYLGESFAYIHPNFPWEVKEDYVRNLHYQKCILTFSTREKAEEYVIRNKPCLCLKDVEHLITKVSNFKKLKEITKSKI